MGGGLKDFFDRTFYPTQGQVTEKPYVAFPEGQGIDDLRALGAKIAAV